MMKLFFSFSRTLIKSLLTACSPADISGFVPFFVVDAIKLQTRRTWTYVIEKRLKIIRPLFAHANATAAPIGVTGMRFVKTSRFCIVPRSIFLGSFSSWRVSVFGRAFNEYFTTQTPAALRSSCNKGLTSDDVIRTALTPTQPNSATVRISPGNLSDYQAAKDFSGKVAQLRHRYHQGELNA